MTDTRLPEQWLGDMTRDGLSDGAFRVWINALIWSVKYQKDGFVDPLALRYLHPEGRRTDLVDELVAAGLWQAATDGGWLILDFLDHQTPAAKLREQREAARVKQQRYRDRLAEERPRDALAEAGVTGNGTGHSTRDMTVNVGQARAGKDREGLVKATSAARAGAVATITEDGRSDSNRTTGSDAWPVARLCGSCGGPMDPRLWELGERSHPAGCT